MKVELYFGKGEGEENEKEKEEGMEEEMGKPESYADRRKKLYEKIKIIKELADTILESAKGVK